VSAQPAQEPAQRPAGQAAQQSGGHTVDTRWWAAQYWPIHVLAVLALTANILLGMWQLSVWQGHRADQAAQVAKLAPVPLDDVLGPDAAFPDAGLSRPVVVAGTWQPAQTVFVSGRTRGSTPGYWVVTPVTMGTGSEIPVVRGFVVRPDQAPAAPTGRTSLVGLLQPAQETGIVDTHPNDDILPELSTTDLLSRTKRDLYGGYVVATGRTPPAGHILNPGTSGLAAASVDNLPNADSFTGLRNLLYALQWWFFGGFVVFMWWRWLNDDVLATGRRASRPPQ
jgi:surfeit locus 1 family protein